MAGNNVKINLLFQADTSAAISNMQQLGTLLNQISTKTHIGIDGGSLSRAVDSAQQLQVHLQNAVNVDTGKLDLNKLNSSLKSSGQNLQTLASNLQAAGPTGQQAFIKVATAIASAETPMVRLNSKLKDFGVTLLNTVKWQLASNAIHGIEGMLNSAVGYAEDLNEALTDIRIVTGYSTDEMATFANQASAAARELSTTTTEYSKAALIFYQQGLQGDAVLERADVVTKLAQVTGESAQAVSNQMTAIWNNFAEGSENLEYYADVLTKLGAATAASTDEISEGLEKFAAVADTVGLSYETAAAAVATVVDKTRQSADVVGTAFKTIFARMQGLNLGETLDDGVTLNKYSQALKQVGIDVLDATGEMRAMDDILDELGSKWDTFSDSTQVALAQTVAGVRQYNQMVALMDNWDSVEKNVELAKNATGELANQQEIWASSYEAAAQRVKQAQNELYQKFVNDEMIIGLNNAFADLIDTVSRVIDSFGGVGPVILMLVGLFSKTLFPIVANGIKSLGNTISVWTGKAAKQVADMQATMSQEMANTLNKAGYSEGVRQQIELSKQLLDVKRQVAAASKTMSLAEQEEVQSRLQMYEAMVAETNQLLEKKAAMEEELRLLKLKLNTETPRSQKRKIASDVESDKFRAANKGRDSDEIDDIVEEATSSTLGATKAELAKLEEQEKTKSARLAEKQKELARVEQSIASHQKALEEKEINNTSSGMNTADGERHLKAWDEQEKKAEKLRAEIEKIEQGETARIERLKEVLSLQEKIQGATEQEASSVVAGTATTTELPGFHEDVAIESYTKNMSTDAMKDIGSVTDEGALSADASIANMEKLYGVMGKYKTQLLDIEALQRDYKNSQSDLASGYEAINQEMSESGKTFQEVLASRQALDNAESNLAQKSETLQAARQKLAEAEANGSAKSQELHRMKKEIAAAEQEEKAATEQVEASRRAYNDTLSASPTYYQEIISSQNNLGAAEADLAQKTAALEQAQQELAAEEAKGKSNAANIAQARKNLKQATGEVVIATHNAKKAQNDYDKTIQKAPAHYKKMVAAQKDLFKSKDKYMELAKSAGATEEELKELSAAFDRLKNGKQTDKDLELINGTLKDLKVASMDTLSSLDQLAEQMKELMIAAGMPEDEINGIVAKLKELSNVTPSVNNGLKGVGEQAEGLGNKLKITGQGVSNTLTSIANGIGQLQMGIAGVQMFIGAFKEGNTPMETFTGILSGLAMILPVVSLAFKNLTAEKRKEMMQTALNIATSIGETAAKGGAIGGAVAHTAALIAEQMAAWGLNTALAPLLAVILLLVAAIAAVVAVAVILVSAFNAIKNSTPEAQLKAAEEEAARLSTELENARAASEALKESIEGYDSAVNKLETLTKGTAEWREALNEANDAARKLIEENPELAGKYSFNTETGLIEFDEGALEGLQEAADAKVTMVQSQSLSAQNNVLDKKNDVLLSDATKGDNAAVAITAGVASGFAAAIPLIGPALATGIQANALMHDSSQQKALSNLAEKFDLADGNLEEALSQMSDSEMMLIDSLNLEKTELQQLCSQLAANNDAIRENNKQLAHSNFSGNKDYENSSNKDFLAEVLGDQVSDKTDELYASKYADGMGMTDAQAQKKYAELMGWDASQVKNKSGNKAVYINDAGEEVTIDDAQVRKYLAQQEALQEVEKTIGETSEKVSQLAMYEKRLANAADGSISSYENYKKQMKEYGKELGLTEEQINSFINSQGNMQEAAKAATLANTIQGWGHGEEDSRKAAESFMQGLSEEEMTLAVKVAAESGSYDEFKRNFEAALNESIVKSFQNSATSVEGIMASIEENGSISGDDMETLKQDENFLAYLEESGQTMLDFTKANYSEKYRIITSYYADLKASESEALQASKENYQADLAEYQAIIDYKNSLNEDGSETEQSKAIKESFDNIDFSAYMDMDITDVKSKMDEVQAAIDEIDGQQIKLDMEWDTTDAIENGMKKVANFTSVMEKDAKKVGNSYQLTAAQAKEWMQVYPDLFANAEVTTDGLISLNGDYVDEFIGGQEASTDAAIEANIEQLESRLSELEAEKAAYEADLELAESNAVGKEQLANASKEYLAETRDKLTQYYIDQGMDEVAAQKAALDTMGLNETEYSELVANAYSRNAENQIASAEQGASGQVGALGKLWNKVKEWASRVGNLFKNVWGALTGKVQWSDVWGSWSGGSIDSGVNVTGISAYDERGNFQEGQEAARTAVLEEVNAASVESLRTTIADIDTRIASIRSEIAYNKALKNQTLSDYGSTDPDDVDGNNTNDEEEKEKDVEDMIDNAERYHEITREIELMEKALGRLAKQKDRAFGADKLAIMDQEIAKSEELLEKEQDLLDAQTVFLASDLAAIEDNFTTDVELDEYGNLANYSDLAEEAETAYNNAKTAYNGSEQSDADKKLLEDAEKEYEEKMALLEQYEETLDAQQEQADKVQDALYEVQDLNFEKLNYELEFEIDLNEKDLERIDYYMSKLGDSAYDVAEAYGYLSSQTGLYTSNLQAQEKYVTQLEADYKAGKISMAAYKEGLAESQTATIDNLKSLEETKTAMREYYGSTMDAALEKVSMYTDQMEHLNSVLDHYTNILELAGKSSDTVTKGKVLESKANNLQNEMATQKKLYENNIAEAEKWREKMESAVEGSNDYETYKANWQAAQAAANEAQDAMLSKTEAWAEAMKAVVENELAGLAQTLEESLTGGTSFDEMITSMDRAQSLQEDYLTTTNQIYETNKMMRAAQKEIDKSSNSVAKKRLQNFISETNEMQNQNKLSQHELKIQQAKYDLLLAEIALEEAQQSKSTVRLQRDSEGNFGYVYTADTSAVSDAEQKLADAQNNLYNIGLEGANDYNQKYAQTLQESQEAITELTQAWMNGEITSEEEYQRKRDELQRYYTEKLQNYSHLYQVSLTTDSNVIRDAWSSDFNDMIYETENWSNAVATYFSSASTSMEKWNSAQGFILSETGLDNVDEAVSSINEQSEKLVDTLLGEDGNGGVVGAMKEEVEAVGELSEAYVSVQNEIDNTIAKYEEFLDKVNGDYTGPDSNLGQNVPTPSTTPSGGNNNSPNTNNTNSNPPSGGSPSSTGGSGGVGSAGGPQRNINDVMAEYDIAIDAVQDAFTRGLMSENDYQQAIQELERDFAQAIAQNEAMMDVAMPQQPIIVNCCEGLGDTIVSALGELEQYKADSVYAKEVARLQDEIDQQAEIYSMEKEAMLAEMEYFEAMVSDLKSTSAAVGAYDKMAIVQMQEIEAMYAREQMMMSSFGALDADILNHILDVIDLQSSSAQIGGLLSSPMMRAGDLETLSQEVHIEAHFPDVRERLEIEEAFNNLINKASQYANRK